jgi:hypothetical protein
MLANFACVWKYAELKYVASIQNVDKGIQLSTSRLASVRMPTLETHISTAMKSQALVIV